MGRPCSDTSEQLRGLGAALWVRIRAQSCSQEIGGGGSWAAPRREAASWGACGAAGPLQAAPVCQGAWAAAVADE